MAEQEKLLDITWIARTKKDLLASPEEIQDEVGYALYLAQQGKMPANAERMKGALREVIAIHTNDDDGATYRTTYITYQGDALYALDHFKKKSAQGVATPQKDLDRIAQRLKEAKTIHAENTKKG